MTPIDLQVNGCAGVDFNADELAADDFVRAVAWMRDEGCSGFLPTLITASRTDLVHRLGQLARRIGELDDDLRGHVLGIHLEGPFLSGEPGYIGAHPADCVDPATPDQAARFLEAAEGLIRVVTLAPEQDPGGRTTSFLVDQGVVVSAGHTDASLDQLRTCIDAGMTMFTHVGNGCPVELPRHDNIVNRALSLAGELTLCFIPDGMHVEFFALNNYLRSAGVENCAVVTDAISAAGGEPGLHPLGGAWVEMGEDGVPRVPSGQQFAGSALGWRQLLENLSGRLGLGPDEIRGLVEENPRRILANATEHGHR